MQGHRYYLKLFIQGVIVAFMYTAIKSNINPKSILQLVLFYIVIQDTASQFGVKSEMVDIIFIGKLVSIYLESCETNKDFMCDTGKIKNS